MQSESSNEEIKGKFYGVYVLVSSSEEKKWRGKIYIGYTVNPNRRIKQHNGGHSAGGAKRTSNRGPWNMVLIVHGFPNNISALRFEWALQQPKVSRRLKNNVLIMKKLQKETFFDYTFRIITEMLRIGPWNRLPLKIRWLDSDYKKNFLFDRLPPQHMRVFEGSIIKEKKLRKKKDGEEALEVYVSCFCIICLNYIDVGVSRKLLCINSECSFVSHLECLGIKWIEPGHYVPIEGDCPSCKNRYLWSDFINNSLFNAKEKEDEQDDVDLSQESDQEEILSQSDSDNDFLTQII